MTWEINVKHQQWGDARVKDGRKSVCVSFGFGGKLFGKLWKTVWEQLEVFAYRVNEGPYKRGITPILYPVPTC